MMGYEETPKVCALSILSLSLSLLPPLAFHVPTKRSYEHIVRRHHMQLKGRDSPEANHVGILISDFQPPDP